MGARTPLGREAVEGFSTDGGIDKRLRTMVKNRATPEEWHRYIVGTAKAKLPQAARIIRRLKDHLGEGHPAIKAIRQDVMFDVMWPLLKDRPNINQFIDNVDVITKQNKSLYKELGLDQTDMNTMKNLTKLVRDLPPEGRLAALANLNVVKNVARLWVGHDIAKSAVKVNLFGTFLGILTGKSRISKKSLMNDFVGMTYGEPAINPKGVVAGRIIHGALAADLLGKQERDQEARRRRLGDEEVGQ